jgi:hypothetical protein
VIGLLGHKHYSMSAAMKLRPTETEMAVTGNAPILRVKPLGNPGGLASILCVLSMTLIPILGRLFIRDLIRRGEREGRKIEAVREKVQVKAAKKNHAR